MPNVLLTYDIKQSTSTIHKELKDHLIKTYKYSEYIQGGNGKWYKLPNTTLRKNNITQGDAAKEFKDGCSAVGATYEKYIAAEYSGATFNSDVTNDNVPN